MPLAFLFVLLLLLLAGITLHIIRLNRKLKRNLRIQTQDAQQARADKRVLELLFDNAPQAEILDAIVDNIQLQSPHTRCAILLLSHDGKQLQFGSTGSDAAHLQHALSDIQINATGSSCGMTALTGRRILIDNIQTRPNCESCSKIVHSDARASCWSEPIKTVNGKTLGVLAFYHSADHIANESDAALIEHQAQLISTVLQKIHNTAALEQSDKLLGQISAEIPGIIFQLQLSPEGKLSFPFISESARKIYGVKPADVRDDANPIFSLLHPEDNLRTLASLNDSARTLTPWNCEFRDLLPSQGIRWRLAKAQPEKSADGSIIWHGFIADITDTKSAQEQIHHMAQYDALTDLPNRALFSDRLQQALAQAKRDQSRFALLFIDFDRFKPINDTLGHAVGDVLLKRAASRMQGCMRESDTIARLGGDEFVVLVSAIDSVDDAKVVAEKIRITLERPFEIADHQLNISVSIGISHYPEQGKDEVELTKNADIAMYYAKNNGRNSIMVYHEGMHIAGQ